ncbi:MAG: HupE/UreJ family protein [Acidimicrobiales bacterium]|nr:HupE/UreJ family protein [Acidimicrobiales bacterium]RZV45227.1 MAG: HupE/UreJ family protein [Acidimicrobiales bacterium]
MSIGRKTLAFIALALAVVIGFAAPAGAHETEQPYVYVFVGEDSIDGRVEFAIGDIAEVLGLDLSGEDPEIEATLRANADRLRAYANDHLRVGVAGVDWTLTFGRVDLFREAPGKLAFAVVQYEADVDAVITDELDVAFDPFFDEIGDRDGLLLITGGFEAGEYARNKEILVTYTSGDRDQVVDLGTSGQWDNFRSSITLGVDHIKTGPDHILFVLALLLPSVLVFRAGWKPIDGFLGALWRVLKIATFFTIAHSITFTLAGMGWLPTPPSKVVETIIAASIAAAALHNLRPIFPNKEWSLSFAFGLFHGMGFASLVSDLDVSRSSQLVSLLGRNVGIEIGQVVVILVLFPALFLLRRTSAYSPFLIAASVVLAGLATLWSIERVFEVDLGTDGIVDGFVSVPRGYVLALIGTFIAAALWVRTRVSGDLLETASLRS